MKPLQKPRQPGVMLNVSAAPAQVTRALEQAGATACTDCDALPVLPIEAVPAQGPAVALFDGKLFAPHAALLSRTPPALMLACRDAGAPAAWEACALVGFLSGAPLMNTSGGQVTQFKVSSLEEIDAICDRVGEMVTDAGGKGTAARIASDVMHELCANALIDAPAGPDGQPLYAHRRGADLEIAAADACRGTLAVEGGRIYLTATDRFGRLTAAPFARAVSSFGAPASIESSGGGAGLGVRRVLEQSDLVAIRVKTGALCEVLSVIELSSGRRRAGSPKSIFYWSGA